MELFLLVAVIIVLILDILSIRSLIKIRQNGFFTDLEEASKSNGMTQVFYVLTGLYVLLILTIMSYVPELILPGAIVSVDTLLFLFIMRNPMSGAPFTRFYRLGPGLYISGAMHFLFFVVTLFYLWV